MPKGIYKLPNITNEPIKSYAPGSPERADLKAKIEEIKNKVVDLPMIIDRCGQAHGRRWHWKSAEIKD